MQVPLGTNHSVLRSCKVELDIIVAKSVHRIYEN